MDKIRQANSDTSERLQREYISWVFTVAAALNISNVDFISQNYNKEPNITKKYFILMNDIDNFVLARSIKRIVEIKQDKVKLEGAAKERLRHHLQQMRELIDSLDLPLWKKDALYNKINALQSEIDRGRSPMAKFGSLVIEICDTVGIAADKLEPLRKWIDPIGSALSQNRDKNIPHIGRSQPPAQLAPPSSKDPKTDADTNDDVEPTE